MTPPASGSGAGAPLAVILNPNAGRGLALRLWPRVENELRRRKHPYEVFVTHSGESALARVRALPADHAVLAVGGDGTIGALLPAIAEARRALAVVPLGSGNDFAGMRGVRGGDVRAALARLDAAPLPVDLLRVSWTHPDGTRGGRDALNGLGMGFDARVAALMRTAPARLGGFGRYLWAALRAAGDLRHGEVALEVDGDATYSGPSVLAAVMNGTRYGGGFRISPESDPADGRLDVVLGRRVNRAQLLRLMGAVLRGQHLDDPRVRCWRGQRAVLRWKTPIHAHVDGELVGEIVEMRVEVRPSAVRVY